MTALWINEGRKYPYRWAQRLKIHWNHSGRTKTLQASGRSLGARLSLVPRVNWTARVLKAPWCPAPAPRLLTFAHWGAGSVRVSSPKWGDKDLWEKNHETTVNILQMSGLIIKSCETGLHKSSVCCSNCSENITTQRLCLNVLVIRDPNSPLISASSLTILLRSSLAVVWRVVAEENMAATETAAVPRVGVF